MSKSFLIIIAFAFAAAACTPSSAPTPFREGTSVIAIGDSIMVAATDNLTATVEGIVINAEEGRPFDEATPTLAYELAANGTPDILVIALGTNAGASGSQIDQVMEIADGIDRVIFVNVRVPRPWESSTNLAIAEAAMRYDNIEVVDWYAASNDNDGLFRKDGYHPNKVGSELWSNLIAVQIKNP